MKVCTDACLFGAWISDVRGQMLDASVLDIGTGTGLLSLMLAQKSGGNIDAVEMDETAAAQAADNFADSPWVDRLHMIQGDVRTVALQHKYDLIISNPPFFENDLQSADDKRNLALHSASLGFEDLIGVIKKYLAKNGKFAVLLPYHRTELFIQLALREGFYLEEEVHVKQTPAHGYFRSMLCFGTTYHENKKSEIVIRDGESYTDAFVDLLKDYYLKL